MDLQTVSKSARYITRPSFNGQWIDITDFNKTIMLKPEDLIADDWIGRDFWYEHIGEYNGILCWAWDDFEIDKELVIIDSCNMDEEYPFKSIGTSFMNARPVTEEEIKKYIFRR